MLKWTGLTMAIATALACAGLDAYDEHDASEEPTREVQKEAAASTTIQFGENEDPIEAYLLSCSAQQTAYNDFDGEQTPSCRWIEFDQMCADDPSGCFGKTEGCKNTCGDPCVTCESECTTDCGTCKETCSAQGGDADACMRACAAERYACQQQCVEGRDACFTRCGERGEACYSEYDEKVERICPQCDEIRECMSEAMFDGGTVEQCEAKFAAVDRRCFEWCPFSAM